MSLQTKTCAIRRELPVHPYLLRGTVAQNQAEGSSSGFPFGAYLPRHAVKGAFRKLRNQQSRWIDRTRHNRASRWHGFEAGLAVIRLVADQDDQLVPVMAGLI